MRPAGSLAPLARNRALPNRRSGPRARTERHTGTGRGDGSDRAPTSAFLACSNSVLRLRRVRGRDRCLALPRRVTLGASAGSEKRRIDAARRWSGAAAESNGSDCWAIVRHPNHARLAQLDGNTVALGPGVADAGRLVRGGLRAYDDG